MPADGSLSVCVGGGGRGEGRGETEGVSLPSQLERTPHTWLIMVTITINPPVAVSKLNFLAWKQKHSAYGSFYKNRALACTPVFEPGGERLPAPSFEEQRTSMIAAAWTLHGQ